MGVMKKMRILILIHPELNPLKRGLSVSGRVDSPCKTEAHVYSALKKLGHQPDFLELENHLDPLVKRINEDPVDMVFNLLEELSGEAKFDFHAVSYLESRGIPFTGNGPRALMLSRDKNLSKLILRERRVKTPRSKLIGSERDLKRTGLEFPVFLKLNIEDASRGITQKNRALNQAELISIYRRLRTEFSEDLLLEEFVEGVDLSVGIVGNSRIRVLPARCLSTPSGRWVADEKLKFQSAARAHHKIRSVEKKWKSAEKKRSFEREARAIYAALGMRGYGRLDFRETASGEIHFLEANANPDLAKDEDFGLSARAVGMSYEGLIEEILALGRRKS